MRIHFVWFENFVLFKTFPYTLKFNWITLYCWLGFWIIATQKRKIAREGLDESGKSIEKTKCNALNCEWEAKKTRSNCDTWSSVFDPCFLGYIQFTASRYTIAISNCCHWYFYHICSVSYLIVRRVHFTVCYYCDLIEFNERELKILNVSNVSYRLFKSIDKKNNT